MSFALTSPFWGLPFLGLLLSIAVCPVFWPDAWEQNYDRIVAFWIAITVIPLIYVRGWSDSFHDILHVLMSEYMPFMLTLLGLFTCAGGIALRGHLKATPLINSGILGLGTALASFIGTTGASMIFIRPLLLANKGRRYVVHVVVFFIFLVANIGGALSPLGDPPLLLGFFRGVDFFWPIQNLWRPTLFLVSILIGGFFILDTWLAHRERRKRLREVSEEKGRFHLEGFRNIFLLLLLVLTIMLSGMWNSGIEWRFFGVTLTLQSIARDLIILGIVGISIWKTPDDVRAFNNFSWHPICEVAILFAGLFICMSPVTALLKLQDAGPFASLVHLVQGGDGSSYPRAYFWITGILSSFLDNAPTYLVFFELAGGDPKTLMTTGQATLAAISAGAVFMGANSYIGNAPNFMIYAIARHNGVNMPTFFGYMLWSLCILIPLFIILTFMMW
jgi:Na+/H+ antiporter NhaD/arsenite permease-like protein